MKQNYAIMKHSIYSWPVVVKLVEGTARLGRKQAKQMNETAPAGITYRCEWITPVRAERIRKRNAKS